MFTFPKTVAKYTRFQDIKICVCILIIFVKDDLFASPLLEYSTITFYLHSIFKKLFSSIIIFISSFNGLTIDLFKTSYVSFSQSIWAFFITYELSYFILISLRINLLTVLNFPWPWSPPTIVSIDEIALLSDLFDYSW